MKNWINNNNVDCPVYFILELNDALR